MISLRQVVEDTYPGVDLSQGLRHQLWNPLYTVEPQLFPFILNQRDSIRLVLDHWSTWPVRADFTELTTYPDYDQTPYSEGIQGVSNSADFWIFSQQVKPAGADPEDITRKFVAWSVTDDLNSWSSAYYEIILTHQMLGYLYDHPGDCGTEYVPESNSYLVAIPLEGYEPNAFGFFEFKQPDGSQNGSWRYLGIRPTTNPQDVGKNSMPWTCFWHDRKMMLSSLFIDQGINIYSYSGEYNGSTMTLPVVQGYEERFELFDDKGSSLTLERIQGGSLTPKGRLFLSIDQKLEDGGGIYAFDMISGRLRFRIPLAGKGPDKYSLAAEIEGLTIWDVDGLGAPNVGGQIHLTYLVNDLPTDDDIVFKHWRVSNAAKPYL